MQEKFNCFNSFQGQEENPKGRKKQRLKLHNQWKMMPMRYQIMTLALMG
jgi:hypothetical protein